MMNVCGDLVCMQMHARGDGKTSQERVGWWKSRNSWEGALWAGDRPATCIRAHHYFTSPHSASHSLTHLLSRPTPTPSRPDAHRARTISAHSLPSPTIRSITLVFSQVSHWQSVQSTLIDYSNTLYQHSTSPARHTAPSLSSSVSSPRLIRWHKQTDRQTAVGKLVEVVGKASSRHAHAGRGPSSTFHPMPCE
jgi:hypothetical protein